MNSWFRFYHEALDDPKVQTLPPDLFRFWVNCLCLAARNEGVLPLEKDVAFACRLSIADTGHMLNSLREAGLLDKKGPRLKPHEWERRQFKEGAPQKGGKYVYLIKSPDSRIVKVGFSKNPWARVVDIRSEAQDSKLKVVAVFPSKAVSEVDMHLVLAEYHHQFEWFEIPPKLLTVLIDYAKAKTSYEDLIGLLRSKHAELLRSTTTNTDTDTDIPPIVPHSGDFDRFWESYPTKVGKAAAKRAWDRLKASRPPIDKILTAIADAKRLSQKWIDGYIPNPATWLNQGRWADEHTVPPNPNKPRSVHDFL